MSVEYRVTVRDNVLRWCPTCAKIRPIYVQVFEGEELMCCGYCQRIHHREEAKDEKQTADA